MPNHSNVVEALVRTRADVSGMVRQKQVELDKLLADLRAIDRTLEIHGYTENAAAVPPRHKFVRQNVEQLVERFAYIKRVLVASDRPLRCVEIADGYKLEQGVEGTDIRTRTYYRNRINAALRSMQGRGEIVMEGGGLNATWRLA